MADLKDQLEKTVKELRDFDKIKNNIDMTITNEGLRIELTESATGTFFDSGSPKISKDGAEILDALAGELGKLPNKSALEGHTDAKPYAAGATYGNWELSSDRANAARRLMVQHDLRTDQVTQVRGFADQRLRKPDAPFDPANRRISLIVQCQQKTKEELEAASAEGGKKGEGEGKGETKGEGKSEAKPGAREDTGKAGEFKPVEGKSAGAKKE
jgi:chemotaxis protein MotB